MPNHSLARELVSTARSYRGNPPQSARALARVFPRFVRVTDNMRCWDPEALYLEARRCTEAERHAARFVLGVWNTDVIPYLDDSKIGYELGQLNIINAMAQWDDYHRAAFLAWANEPWFL